MTGPYWHSGEHRGKACEREAEMGGVCPQPRNPGGCWRPWTEGWGILSQSFRREPARHPDFGPLAFRKDKFVLSYAVCGAFLWQPQETNTLALQRKFSFQTRGSICQRLPTGSKARAESGSGSGLDWRPRPASSSGPWKPGLSSPSLSLV